MTERSYQWDKDNNRSSANRMKTAAKREIINSFLTYNSMIKQWSERGGEILHRDNES